MKKKMFMTEYYNHYSQFWLAILRHRNDELLTMNRIKFV